MTATENPTDALRAAMAQNLEQARKAMMNYFQFVEKSLSSSPLGANNPAQTLRKLIESNVEATFDLSDKLLHARDVQDVMKIQTEFFQTRMQALSEQTKEFRDTAAKAGFPGVPPVSS
jgi:phasin